MKAKKRLLSLLLCGTMLFSLCPQSVLAETSAQDSGAAISAGGLCKHHSEHDEDCGYTEGTAGSPCTYEHTDDCYREVINCIHKHDQDCYLQDSVSEDDATPSNAEKREPENCPHICDEDSGCVTKKLDCRHEHDDACGYAPATKGTPCKYVCQICDPQDSGSASGQSAQKPGEEVKQDGDECICTEPCWEDNVNVDCPVCGIIEEEDLALCKGVKPETATPSNAVQLSAGDVQKLIDGLPTADELAVMSLEEQQEVYEKLQAAYEAYNALTEEQKEEVIGAEIFDSLFDVFNGMMNTLANEEYNINDKPVTIDDSCGDNCSSHKITGNGQTTNNTITVEGGTHNITLQDVNIQVSDNDSCAFKLEDNAKVNLTFSGTNVLKSGTYCAGLQVPDGTTLTITGDETGSLTAIGGYYGAGIGSGGSDIGAGNGGGRSGAGGTITISGGTVSAQGASVTIGTGDNAATYYSAGIGDGIRCSGSDTSTFTANGDAIIFAAGGKDTNGGGEAISDTTGRDSWKGIIFESITYDKNTFSVSPPILLSRRIQKYHPVVH